MALVAVWLAAGVRRVPEDRFGVVDAPLLGPRQVRSGLTLAPPLLTRLATYPLAGVELALPQADRAMLAADDGSRYGYRGWATVRARPERWRELHAAAGGAGLEGALLDAIRATAESGPRIVGGTEYLTDADRRRLESALDEALAARGVDLRRLEVDALDFLAVTGAGEAGAASGTRLLVVGLDGADWAIVDELIAEGRLPNLERLIENGTRAKLLSISPLLSPVIWTTAATGVEPSRHGILDFLVADPADGSRQPVTSAQRRVPAVWEILSRSGIDVGVTGWWASWPADPVRGYMVSDRLAYQLFGYTPDPDDARGKTWPPDLYEDIRELIVPPDAVPWSDVTPYLTGDRTAPADFDDDERTMLDEFRTLIAAGRTHLAVGTTLAERFRPDLEIVYFEGTDTVGHLFMPYRAPRLPGIDESRFDSFREIVDRYYETADAQLGHLLEGHGDDWTVMVLSDHGFASDATRPRSTDSRIGHGAAADWHRRFGILVLSGARIVPGAEIPEASVYDIAPTVLALFGQPVPRSWPGRVLGQAIDPEFLARNPVRYRLDDPEREHRAALAGSDPAAAALLEKLESLGYISGGGGPEGEEAVDSVTARNNAGVALLAEGRFAEAEAEFRAGLADHPGAPMLAVNLGLALRVQGRLDEAAALFERAIEIPQTLRMAGTQLAQIRLDQGRLADAEALARRVLEREPDAAEVRNTLGLVLEAGGDVDGAREQWLRAADLDPDSALPRNNLGNVAKREGDLATAETWYLRAIEADPYFMGAFNNLALVYQTRGEMQRAIDLYGRALAKSPRNAVVQNNLASLYYATGDVEEARRLWRQAAAIDPSYPSPLNNLASLEINAGRWAEAERLLRRALELDEGYGDARLNLALVHRARGDLDAARRELRLAAQDPRTGANGWRQLGLFELEQGRNEAAVEALERGAEAAPDAPGLLNPLGEALLRAGRPADAAAAWRRSLALRPDQPRLRQALGAIEGGG